MTQPGNYALPIFSSVFACLVDMLIPTILCLSAAAVFCDDFGWKSGNIYKYDFNGCRQTSHQTFELMKADLYIQPLSADELSVTIKNTTESRTAYDTYKESCGTIREDKLNFKSVSYFSGRPFKINLNKGVVTNRNASHNITGPIERMFVKLITSQLQLDLKGENCKDSKTCQLPTETEPNAVFKTTENSSLGLCETRYKVSPLPSSSRHPKSDSTAFSGFLENGQLFEIVKNSDKRTCQRSSSYAFDEGPLKFDNVSFSDTNRIVISGNVKQYIIKSTVSTKEFTLSSPSLKQLPAPTEVLVTNLTLTSIRPE